MSGSDFAPTGGTEHHSDGCLEFLSIMTLSCFSFSNVPVRSLGVMLGGASRLLVGGRGHLFQMSSPGVSVGAVGAASGCWGTGGDTFFDSRSQIANSRISPRRGSVEDSFIRRASRPILSFRQRPAELESAARSPRLIASPRRGDPFSPRQIKPKTRTRRAVKNTGNERV